MVLAPAVSAFTAATPEALLLGSAVNQDGRTASLTAPNGPAQEAVISHGLREAGVLPAAPFALDTHQKNCPKKWIQSIRSLKMHFLVNGFVPGGV